MKCCAISSALSDPFIKSHLELSLTLVLFTIWQNILCLINKFIKKKKKTFFKGLIQNKPIDEKLSNISIIALNLKY